MVSQVGKCSKSMSMAKVSRNEFALRTWFFGMSLHGKGC